MKQKKTEENPIGFIARIFYERLHYSLNKKSYLYFATRTN